MTQIIVTVPGVTFDNMLFGDGWQLAELEGWWDTTKPRVGSDPRPEWHGDFGQDNVYLEPRFITVSGVFQSRENPDLVMSARDAITALHEAGEFDFTVSDGVVGRVTARLASEISWDVDYAPGCASFEFTVKADDPRRYGLGQSFGTGVPTPGVGVDDPVLDPVQEGVAVDVATNYAPSLYGPTVPVEVRRNRSTNPVPVGLSGYVGNRCSLALVDGWVEGTVTEVGYFPRSSVSTSAVPVVPGDVVTVSSDVGTGSPVRARIGWFSDAGGLTPMLTPVEGALSASGRHGLTVVVPAGVASFRAEVGTDSNLAVGQKFRFRRTLVAVNDPAPYVWFLPGDPSPDPDTTARWIGAANASEPVLDGQHPTGLTDSSCVSIIHEVGDGTRELRIIPTGNAASSGARTYFNIPAGTLRTVGGTIIGRLRQDGPVSAGSSSVNAFVRRLRAATPVSDTPIQANVAGTYEHRLVYGAVTADFQAQLGHGGIIGSGDVYWSKIGLFAGDYQGPWFDGNTQPHDNYIYKWAGVPYESAAIKQQIMHTPGNPGRIELTNTGTAPAEPMVRVTGGLSEGFELLCIETGSVVRVTRPIPDGSVIDIDMGGGQVWIDQQSPLSAMYVPVAEWFSVKPGATCTIQFTPLGVVTGTPMMTVEFAEASW